MVSNMQGVFFENNNDATENYPLFSTSNKATSFPAHFHKELEIYYVRQGCVSFVINSRTYQVKKGDILFCMPGEVHTYFTPATNTFAYIKMNTKTGKGGPDLSLFNLKDNLLSIENPHYKDFKDTFEDFIKEAESENIGREFAVIMYANKLVMLLLRYIEHYRTSANEKKQYLSKVSFLVKVNEYIEKNHSSKITLDDISRYCNISKYHFVHSFRDTYGESFVDYLNKYRLEQAINIMKNSGNSLTEIAYNCGFNNLRTFNRTFTRHYKMGPARFRKQLNIGEVDNC